MTGRVVDKQGHPFTRASLVLFQFPFRTGGSIVRHFLADEKGEYRSGGLPKGKYRIEFSNYELNRLGNPAIEVTDLSKGQHRQVPDLIAPYSRDAVFPE